MRATFQQRALAVPLPRRRNPWKLPLVLAMLLGLPLAVATAVVRISHVVDPHKWVEPKHYHLSPVCDDDDNCFEPEPQIEVH